MDFHFLPVMVEGYPHFQGKLKPPSNFDKMLEVSRALSTGVDFVRVDLYGVKAEFCSVN